jgi:uncharacterized protein YndB with AHSA1/START domain
MLRSVRATRSERARDLPGDELIPNPVGSFTHATTVRRPPKDVWPWLVQMGAGSRAGWYSYDFIDNGWRPSATRIVPELQTVAVGTLYPAGPGVTEGFHVLSVDAPHYLVLGWRPPDGVQPMVTWAFVLEEQSDGSTRLIVRARGNRDYPFYGLPPWIGMPFVRVGHFIMERRQLLGIASRVESHRAA